VSADTARLAAVEAAIVARRPHGRLARRIVSAYLVALVAAPPVTVAVLALTRDGALAEAPVRRVVSARCVDGRITQGIDTGRTDGRLLAYDTGETC